MSENSRREATYFPGGAGGLGFMSADHAPASDVSCIKNLKQGRRTYSLLVIN